MRLLRLTILPGTYSICRCGPGAPLESWMTRGEFSSVTRTLSELSIVVESLHVPAGVTQEPGHALIRFEGPLPLELVGVLASALVPLAEAGISVFVVSSYDLDYLLVKQARLEETEAVLKRAGHALVRLP